MYLRHIVVVIAIIQGIFAGPAPTARSGITDYELYSSRIARKRNNGVGQALRYAGLGAALYLGNRIAHFIDSKFISRFTEQGGNSTAVEDLRREQEELWRVVDALHKGQSEKVDTLGLNTEQRLAVVEKSIVESADRLAARLAELEAEEDSAVEADVATLQETVKRLSEEMGRYEATMAALKESIPGLLSSHDAKVLERLKSFSNDVKELLRNRPSSSRP